VEQGQHGSPSAPRGTAARFLALALALALAGGAAVVTVSSFGSPAGGTSARTTDLEGLSEKENVAFHDMGAGCCIMHGEACLFNDHLGDRAKCEQKCKEFPDCGFINHGWRNGKSTWCTVMSTKTRATCAVRDTGPSGCGSSGNDGVHVYQNPEVVTFHDMGPGCCMAGDDTNLFDGHVGGLAKCEQKCREFPDCGFITHGWEHGTSDRCVAVSTKADCSTNIEPGPSKCATYEGARVYQNPEAN